MLAAAGAPVAARADRAIGVAPGNQLLDFDTATPNTVTARPITGLGAGETVRGIDARVSNGQLYAGTVVSGSVANSIIKTYTVNPDTGAASLVGQTAAGVTGAGDFATGWDIKPRGTVAQPTQTDRARYVNAGDENVRINTDDGTLAGNDTDLTPGATTAIIAAAYDTNTTGDTNTLYAINRVTSTLSRIGGVGGTPSPNGGVATDLAPLGFTLHAANDAGFDISPSGVFYAAMTSATDSLTRLYVFPPGQVTPVGLIGNGATEVRSLTILPSPPAPTPAATPPPVAQDSTAPIVNVSGVSQSVPFKSFLSGLKPTVTANEPASLDLALQGTIKRATVSAFELALASASLGSAGGSRSVTLKPRAKLVGKPKRAFRVRLHIVATDAAGNRSTADQTITVKPKSRKKARKTRR
jgi:hypothetical protein